MDELTATLGGLSTNAKEWTPGNSTNGVTPSTSSLAPSSPLPSDLQPNAQPWKNNNQVIGSSSLSSSSSSPSSPPVIRSQHYQQQQQQQHQHHHLSPSSALKHSPPGRHPTVYGSRDSGNNKNNSEWMPPSPRSPSHQRSPGSSNNIAVTSSTSSSSILMSAATSGGIGGADAREFVPGSGGPSSSSSNAEANNLMVGGGGQHHQQRGSQPPLPPHPGGLWRPAPTGTSSLMGRSASDGRVGEGGGGYFHGEHHGRWNDGGGAGGSGFQQDHHGGLNGFDPGHQHTHRPWSNSNNSSNTIGEEESEPNKSNNKGRNGAGNMATPTTVPRPPPPATPRHRSLRSYSVSESIWRNYRALSLESSRQMDPSDARHKAVPSNYVMAYPLDQYYREEESSGGNGNTGGSSNTNVSSVGAPSSNSVVGSSSSSSVPSNPNPNKSNSRTSTMKSSSSSGRARSSFGYPTSVFKVMSLDDGRLYCLRRIDDAARCVSNKIASAVRDGWVNATIGNHGGNMNGNGGRGRAGTATNQSENLHPDGNVPPPPLSGSNNNSNNPSQSSSSHHHHHHHSTRRLVDHPNLVRLYRAFVSQRAVFFVHGYHPGARTMLERYFPNRQPSDTHTTPAGPPPSTSSAPSASLAPPPPPTVTTPTPSVTSSSSSMTHSGRPLPEPIIWSLTTQLVSAIRAVHDAGLAVRTLQLNHILVMPMEEMDVTGGGYYGGSNNNMNGHHGGHAHHHHHHNQHHTYSPNYHHHHHHHTPHHHHQHHNHHHHQHHKVPRLRINCIGVIDALEFESRKSLPDLQREDMISLGRILLSLSTGTEFKQSDHELILLSSGVELHQHHHHHHHRSNEDKKTTSNAVWEGWSRYDSYLSGMMYSQELRNLISSLLLGHHHQQHNQQQGVPTVHDVVSILAERSMDDMDGTRLSLDRMSESLSSEYESGRALRLLLKLGFVNERPEFGVDSRWSETGDCYVLKLFRDYVFHQADGAGRPVMDLGHIITSLNKLDASDEEKIVLTSRDGSSLLVVSFADVARCLENAYGELCDGSVVGGGMMGAGGENDGSVDGGGGGGGGHQHHQHGGLSY